MKKIFLTCLSIILITLVSFAQKGVSPGIDTSRNTSPVPNAYKTKEIKVMNGDSSLGLSYNRSACGLNYAVDKWIITHRAEGLIPPMIGFGLPATLNFTKLPTLPCYKIDTAFLYWTASYRGLECFYNEDTANKYCTNVFWEFDDNFNTTYCGTPKSPKSTITITNPNNTTTTYTNTIIGTDGSKKWWEKETRTYKADVTSAITGNGTYTVDITKDFGDIETEWETDGMMLIVVYRDPSATYQGTLLINDGCFTRSDAKNTCGFPTTDSITWSGVCGNSTNANAFLLVSDLQRNAQSTFQATLNGTIVTDSSNFFNFTSTSTSVTAGQSLSQFGIGGNLGPDCYTLAVTGLYYQTTSCVTCVPSDTSTALSLTKASTPAMCGKNDGSATVSPVGGARPYKYTWLSPATGNDSVAKNLLPGTYTVIVNDNACKSKVDSVKISSMGQVQLATPTTTAVACFGGSNGSAKASTTIGKSPFQYLWTGGQTSPTAVNLSAGTYTVQVTDSDGCTDSKTVTITQPNAIVLTSKSDSSFCGKANGTATVSISSGGTSPFSYSWNTSPVAQTSAIATGLADGMYTVTVTDAKGCSKQTSITVSPTVSTMKLSTTPLGSSCGGTGLGGTLSANITSGTAPFTYLWRPGLQITPSIANLPAGTYTVLATDAKGCTMQKVDSIPVAVQPNALFTVSQNIACDGISTQFTNRSTLATSYVWNFGDNTSPSTLATPSHTFPATGIFVITLTAEKPPCKDMADTTIVIGSMGMGEFPIASTNIFTPNSDGQNDCFTLAPTDTAYTTAYAIKHCLYLEVFDRWGVKVFESDDTHKCWDGNNKKDNKPAMNGTYYYVAKLGETTIKGSVTLIR